MRGNSPGNVLLVERSSDDRRIERWQEDDSHADVRSTTIGGFPAVVATPTQFSDYCGVDVDVAAGQILDVQFGADTSQAPIPRPNSAFGGQRAAAYMLMTLLAR